VAVLPARLGVPKSQAECRPPSRRRLLSSEGPKGSRGLILLLAALIAELAWLVTLGYALFHFLA
jgi:hypothetical protein